MLRYIKDIAMQTLAALGPPAAKDVFELVRTLSEELDRLDPRDFAPAVRTEFATSRIKARTWSREPRRAFSDDETLARGARQVLTHRRDRCPEIAASPRAPERLRSSAREYA